MKSINKKIERLESQIAKEKEKLLLYEEQRSKHMYNVFHGGTEYTQHLAQKEVNKLNTLIRKTKARIEEKENALSTLLSDKKATQKILAQSEITTIESQTTQEEDTTILSIGTKSFLMACLDNAKQEDLKKLIEKYLSNDIEYCYYIQNGGSYTYEINQMQKAFADLDLFCEDFTNEQSINWYDIQILLRKALSCLFENFTIPTKKTTTALLSSDEKTIAKSQSELENNQEQPIQEVIAHKDSIQQIQGNSIESSFIHYIKSIMPMDDITTQESNDNVVFSFSIKKSDLIVFKAPKLYSSYEHSIKIKKGQELARQKGIKIGLTKGSKRQRKDKQLIIDQIKKLSISFNGDKNNHELSKILHCSLNRICSYKKKIKENLENSQLNLFNE